MFAFSHAFEEHCIFSLRNLHNWLECYCCYQIIINCQRVINNNLTSHTTHMKFKKSEFHELFCQMYTDGSKIKAYIAHPVNFECGSRSYTLRDGHCQTRSVSPYRYKTLNTIEHNIFHTSWKELFMLSSSRYYQHDGHCLVTRIHCILADHEPNEVHRQ